MITYCSMISSGSLLKATLVPFLFGSFSTSFGGGGIVWEGMFVIQILVILNIRG